MPFTISHAVVALPFRRARWLVPAGIAAGAMAPDVPLFLPALAPYAETHELWAAPTIDVVLAYLLLAGWSGLIRIAILALAPRRIAPRLPADWRLRVLPAPSVALAMSLAIGALTHVTWDAFTHRGRLGSELIPALADHVGPVALTSLLQYASSVVGFAVLVVWAIRTLHRRTIEAESSPRPIPTSLRRALVVALVALAAVVPTVTALASANLAYSARAFAAITGSIDILVLLLSVVSIGLAASEYRARRTR